MSGVARRIVVFALACAAPICAHAAKLQCTLDPARPVVGEPVQWTLTARGLAGSPPSITQTQLAPDWLLHEQQGSSETSGGQRVQTVRSTLFALRAGELRLPAVAADGASCAGTSVTVAPSSLVWRTRYAPGQPLRLQPVRVELRVAGASNWVWNMPDAHSGQAVLTALGTDTGTERIDGTIQPVQIFTWQVLPLQAGPLRIDFGLVRAHAFGALRVLAPPPLTVDVRALPLWWPAGGIVGRPALAVEQSPRHLRLGATAVWRLRLSGAGLDETQVRAAIDQWVGQWPAALGFATYAVRQTEDSCWEISVFARPSAGGRRHPPALRLAYFDLATELPDALRWTPPAIAVDDPRPAHLALGVGGAAALLALLFGLRAATLRMRQRRTFALALRALEASADGAALRRAWLALPTPRGRTATTLTDWLDDAPPGFAAEFRADAQTLDALVFGNGDTAATPDGRALAARLRRAFRAYRD